MKRYNVYRQDKPQPTGQTFTFKDAQGVQRQDEWHQSVLTKVGEAESFAEAKKLTPYPIMEAH